jgi:tryptophan-rich sensory protein
MADNLNIGNLDVGNLVVSNWIKIGFPIAVTLIFSIASVSSFQNSKIAGKDVKIRPPPWVFGLAWTILYTLIGISWYYANNNNNIMSYIFYSILNISLFSWILTYSSYNNKIGGVYALVISIICTIWCYTIGNTTSKLLITPLLGWLFLATLINVLEVSNVPEESEVPDDSKVS